MWKIINNSTPAQNIKIAVAKNNTTTIGVILGPNQFCISDSRMTSSIDAQSKRNFITIEENYTNDLGLELCQAYNGSDVDEARKQAEEYKG
jgi:hypothetical protein